METSQRKEVYESIFDIKACCFYAYDLKHQAASVNVHFYEGTLMQCSVKG